MDSLTSDALELGRASYRTQAWKDAIAHFARADFQSPLEATDVEAWAVSACLAGELQQSGDLWARAHVLWAEQGDVARAVRNAFWVGFGLIYAGEFATGSGWIERAQRMLDEAGGDWVEQGYLHFLTGLRAIFQGDITSAHSAFTLAGKVGNRFGNPELCTFARAGEGRALIYMGDIADGVALIDEALAAVVAGEVPAIAAGNSYCVAIDGCQEVFDVRRAQEWTRRLSDWCEKQPQMVLYGGICMVHRAEIMVLHGDWEDAHQSLEHAHKQLDERPLLQVMGPAFYCEGELSRLTGAFAAAESYYRSANQWGKDPQPGLALMRLRQGNLEGAMAGIRRAVVESRGPVDSGRTLEPNAEISLAGGDFETARVAAEELSALADELRSDYLKALAAYATGTFLLATGDPASAMAPLRRAWHIWHELKVPYEQARTRLQLGLALQGVGDQDSARMELDAARAGFAALGAVPDMAHIEELTRPAGSPMAAGLTPRELEVLRLVATGRTNRAIASALVVSEKTVATHIGHIFTKLWVESRAAATAFAYENGLV